MAEGVAESWRWPFALEEVAHSLVRVLATENRSAERIEITFGDGAIELLGREVLRRVTTVARFQCVPVVYPERPFALPRAVDVKVLCRDGGRRASIPALIVAASAGG